MAYESFLVIFFIIIIILLGVFCFFCFKAQSIICTINSKVLYRFPANLRFSAVIFLWFHGIWGLECSNLDVLCQEKALSASRVFITSNLNCILDFLEEKKKVSETVEMKMSHFLSLNLHELVVKCWSLNLQFLNHKICLFHPIKEHFNLYGYLSLKAIREVGGERKRSSLNQ